ncbi:YfcC family protein [Halochromatium glycolicum]|uniref:C4-dicarboxylate ABC transporter n=1 Tax=Halochromatium glycolicum TaxID=85075 RepID=A0AAJ0U3U1_9GAMM|nr:YfcC family protein [Halochromatium glycolicum]MBK1704335.1 C4-dicarboxylate ABC transporter [Halochromatium glycolicum]
MCASPSSSPSSITEGNASRPGFQFPSAVTTLAIVMVLVWVAALFIPSGRYAQDADGSPIPGTFERIESPLSFGERVEQLILAPVNGIYGLLSPAAALVDTEIVGRLFGQIGIIVFIMSIGAFISISFATRSLEVAVAALANRLRNQGWLLITAVMVLFSLLGTTMGFSVETLGFYALFIPLMTALGYDRLVTAAMIIVGSVIGIMAATVNPFSIGVAAGEAGVGIGEGILLRVILWVLLTAMGVVWVLRYAARTRADPSLSLVGFEASSAEGTTSADAEGTTCADDGASRPDHAPPPDAANQTLSGTQKWVLAITVLAFGLMIFSVIPWASILGGTTGPANYYTTHEIAGVKPFWFELDWWFPELAMLFLIASVLVGLVARMDEQEIVRLIKAGASDMMGPAMVILLAGGVSVIMTNTQTLGTILYAMEQLIMSASAGAFAVATMVVNIPLAFVIPSSSGHAALAMPLLTPLADFAGVGRPLTITAWILGHGLALLVSPTNVVVIGGLAIAQVGYDKYLRFIWPLLLALFVVSAAVLVIAASLA